MSNRKIKGLVFDMDGLLLDSERIVQRTWEDVGESFGIPHMGQVIYHTLGMNRAARDRLFVEMFGADFPLEQFAQRTRERFYQIVEAEGLPVKKGAKELLEYAKANGYKTAVATSSSMDYASKILKQAGLYDYFEAAVYGNMVTHSKPDPEIYLKACEQIGLMPSECIALEDALGGIRSAHAAGLYPIMIPDMVQPTEEIEKMLYRKYESLLEVIDLLGESVIF